MGVCATIAEYIAYVATDKRKEMNNMVLREQGRFKPLSAVVLLERFRSS